VPRYKYFHEVRWVYFERTGRVLRAGFKGNVVHRSHTLSFRGLQEPVRPTGQPSLGLHEWPGLPPRNRAASFHRQYRLPSLLPHFLWGKTFTHLAHWRVRNRRRHYLTLAHSACFPHEHFLSLGWHTIFDSLPFYGECRNHKMAVNIFLFLSSRQYRWNLTYYILWMNGIFIEGRI
jgi:hypothetical protein